MGRPKNVREGLTVSAMWDELGDAEGDRLSHPQVLVILYYGILQFRREFHWLY